MRIHLRMLGCRLNQAEIDAMARQFQQQGHEIVTDPAQADHIVINTCAVTHSAASSGRKLLREMHRVNAEAEITVTGCYAQIAPDEINTLPGVARIINNVEKDSLVQTITGVPDVAIEPFDAEPISRDMHPGATGRTRAFVKVQDGCDNACTFCVTTVARGQGRSQPLETIIHEVQDLHAAGYQEFVLTGVHLGSYGHDLGDKNGLKHLVAAILRETDIPRLRLSSLEPWDLAPGFFDLWENPRLCPHLHLPLQSGCDDTLRRMRRNTSQTEFRALVQAARAAIPNLNITSDVIVGFPGETDAEFAISKAFIEELQFGGLHVFRYSKRPGTPAARMRDHIPNAVKKARSAALIALSDAMEARMLQAHHNQTVNVLWEHIGGASERGFINIGYTENYIRVQAVHPRVLTNTITPAQVIEYNAMARVLVVQPVLDDQPTFEQSPTGGV